MDKRCIVLLALLSGCASVDPYIEVGLGYRPDGMVDEILSNGPVCVSLGGERVCHRFGGRNPTFRLRGGVKMPRNLKCEIEHQSHLRDGRPFNSHPETGYNEIACFKGWGRGF